MGLLDSALGGITSMLSNPGSLIQAGTSLIGGMLRNQSQADQVTQANQFSAQQFANRYQTTVKDMQAAGLNPMLAYQQGASGQPSGQQAVMQDVLSPAVSAYQNSYQTELDRSRAQQAASSASLNERQERLVNATVEKTLQDINQSKAAETQLRAIVDNLYFTQRNLIREGENLEVQNKVLKESINQIISQTSLNDQLRSKAGFEKALTSVETELRQYDVEAARGAGNLGREFSQYKPILDLLTRILGRR